MNTTDIPALRIGNLEVNPPIIQGGMGVRVSRAKLAAAVAKGGTEMLRCEIGKPEEDIGGRNYGINKS